jgi:hypothetical protein
VFAVYDISGGHLLRCRGNSEVKAAFEFEFSIFSQQLIFRFSSKSQPSAAAGGESTEII